MIQRIKNLTFEIRLILVVCMIAISSGSAADSERPTIGLKLLPTGTIAGVGIPNTDTGDTTICAFSLITFYGNCWDANAIEYAMKNPSSLLKSAPLPAELSGIVTKSDRISGFRHVMPNEDFLCASLLDIKTGYCWDWSEVIKAGEMNELYKMIPADIHTPDNIEGERI